MATGSSSWCHFPQQRPLPIVRPRAGRAHQGGRAVSKFSYLAVQKRDDNDGGVATEDLARIVGHPLKKKGHVILDICNARGEYERRTVTKRKLRRVTDEQPEYGNAYYAARKSTWGGVWPHSLSCGISRPAPQQIVADGGHSSPAVPGPAGATQRPRAKR